MGQITIADLPEEVRACLRRRAEQHGRSLESEALALLAAAPDVPSQQIDNEPFGTVLNRLALTQGMTEEAWQDFDRSLEKARLARHDSIHRDVDFDGPEWDFLDAAT